MQLYHGVYHHNKAYVTLWTKQNFFLIICLLYYDQVYLHLSLSGTVEYTDCTSAEG